MDAVRKLILDRVQDLDTNLSELSKGIGKRALTLLPRLSQFPVFPAATQAHPLMKRYRVLISWEDQTFQYMELRRAAGGHLS